MIGLRNTGLLAAAAATLPLACSGVAVAQEPKPSFAVYALSRGQGVPEPTRAALAEVRELLEGAKRRGAVLRVEEGRIGLEGETRLCAEFDDRTIHADLLARARAIAGGTELLNVVEESCERGAMDPKPPTRNGESP